MSHIYDNSLLLKWLASLKIKKGDIIFAFVLSRGIKNLTLKSLNFILRTFLVQNKQRKILKRKIFKIIFSKAK